MGELKKLENLNLENCSKITTINNSFENAKLTTLDLSGCSSLKTIENSAFKNANLTTLDLSSLKNLTTIENYAFQNAKLTTLDLSGCSSLTDIGSYSCNSIVNSSKTIVKLSDEVKKLLNTNDKKNKIFGNNNWNKIPGLNF